MKKKQEEIKIPAIDFSKQPPMVQKIIIIVGVLIGITVIKKVIPSWQFSILIGIIIALGAVYAYYKLVRPIIQKQKEV